MCSGAAEPQGEPQRKDALAIKLLDRDLGVRDDIDRTRTRESGSPRIGFDIVVQGLDECSPKAVFPVVLENGQTCQLVVVLHFHATDGADWLVRRHQAEQDMGRFLIIPSGQDDRGRRAQG